MDTTLLLPLLRKRFWFFLGLTLVVYFFMRGVSGGLSGAAIVAFEMAKTTENAAAIINGWDAVARQHFLHSIYADFLFILTYAGAFFYGCRYAGHLSGNYILRKAGGFFSWLALGAGLFDVVENAGMIYTIRQQVIPWVVHLSYDMAAIKFSLLFIQLLFIGVSLFFFLLDKALGSR